MSSIGWFFPIFLIGTIVIVYLLCLIDQLLEPKGSYEKWLKEELRKNPGYINWLKSTNSGRDYKLGLKILKKLRKGVNNIED